MAETTDSARDVARTNFKATVISALLGCVGVIAAAFIGKSVGRTQGRAEVQQTMTQQDVQLEQRDKQIAQLQADLKSCRQAQLVANTGTASGTAATTNPASAWREPQQNEEFSFTLKSCSRSGDKVACSFTVVATHRDRDLHIFGNSRIVDQEGKQQLASSIALAGSDHKVDRYTGISEDLVRGVPVSGGVTFDGVDTRQSSLPLIEFVVSGGNVQFRNVPVS